ncbi:MAG TPA: beta-galactosidase [Kiritimatiellia bacterium]|nr:beta-galactosidase [Kiritimatiellia bacterium]
MKYINKSMTTTRSWGFKGLVFALWIASTAAFAGGQCIEMRNGYFWDPLTTNYWVPHGFAYQTINPPVFATQSPEQIDYDLLEMKKMHADSLRVDFTWGYIEPTNDMFSWTATDHIIATAEKYGLRLFVLIGYQYAPGWASNSWKGVNSSNQTANLLNYEHPLARAAYTDFISRVTARYKDSKAVAGWILGNEYAYFDLWEANDPHLFVGYDTNYSLPSFRAYLTNLYGGSISALNGKWGTAYANFDAVLMPTNYPGNNEPGTPDLQNRYYPAYHDLIQWRKKSVGDFVAIGSVAAKNADTNHLRSYSMVGGIYSGFDANNTCEDAKTIVARCMAAGAALDFWSINNYAWASEGNELRTAQFGITKYQDQSGLPVLVTETGHSSTENLFPGAAGRQPQALPGQVWEVLMAGGIGTHIFTWNDRPFGGSQIREAGFGIVQQTRLIKSPVYWNIAETFRRMEQVNVHNLFGASRNPPTDINWYWSSDADMVWGRANQENCMLWGGLKRLGYEPNFIDEDDLDAGTYTNARALLLSHAFMMRSNRVSALTNVIAAGVNIHANGVLPGRYDSYHKENPGWAPIISDIFGLSVAGATNFWHGGISGGWEQPYTSVNLQYLTTLGPLNATYVWTNVTTWIRQANVTAASGTTVVNSSYDYYGIRTLPGLQIKGHGAQGKAAINTFTLGDMVPMWWLSPRAEEMVWQIHYDWGRAIYRTWFGMDPAVDISGAGYFYVVPDFRTCTNGSVLISLLNESSNAVTITVTATNLMKGKTVERLSSAGGVMETASDGIVSLTLAGDEYVLLYAYTNNESLVNTSASKVWIATEPPGIWPKGSTVPVKVGYDTRGASLDLYLALERTDGGVTEFFRTNVAGVSNIGTNTLSLLVPDPDLANPRHVSSAEGATWKLHAWLQNGATTQGECRLETRVLWGAKPVSLPATVTNGQLCNVSVLWQELPSYLSSEYPTPLSRADVWQTSMASTEVYTVFLDLMTGSVAVVSSSVVMSAGSGTNAFVLTASGTGPFAWRARTISGSFGGPTSNNHDVVDNFEDRAPGDGASYILPWASFAYAESNGAANEARGITDKAFEGTNAVFLTCMIPSPKAWGGFGMVREFSTAWTLPGPAERTNIWFSFDYRDTNGFTGTLEMKVEDSSGGALSYTQPYTGTAWSNVRARLSQFTGTMNTSDVKKLTLVMQAAQRDVTYVAFIDRVCFTGTPYVAVSGGTPETGNDVIDSFEDRTIGDYKEPAPWTAGCFGTGGQQYYNFGYSAVASHLSKGCWWVYGSHTNALGTSAYYMAYTYANSFALPTNLAQVGLAFDFYEESSHNTKLEIQVKDSTGGVSSYSKTYTPGSPWDTISANMDQFTGTLNPEDVKEIAILMYMLDANATYVGHLDYVLFTNTSTGASGPFTNGLYLSINDTSAGTDSDGDGILDIYETNTGIWNGPTDTGTNPNDADSDDDGLNDGDEVIAGTNPNSNTSVFELGSMADSTASGVVVEWFARTNKVYAIHHFDGSLVEGGPFEPLGTWTNITVASDGITNVVDTTAGSITSRFYRITVRQAP